MIIEKLLFRLRFASKIPNTSALMASSDIGADFKKILSQSSNVLFLTGAGVSAESGIPTFRGAGGLWRTYDATKLATPEAFRDNPSLVWEFYHYRRELVLSKKPNPAHVAIAQFQKRMRGSGKQAWVITQNIDGFHQAAGTQDVVELHGSLFHTRCTQCGDAKENKNSPIVPALLNKGAPDPSAQDAKIPESKLPRCSKPDCNGLVRPHVVWFGESLPFDALMKSKEIMDSCDLCIVVGTSSQVYPAAMFAPNLAQRGVPVAEFNLEKTDKTDCFRYHFHGKAGETLPPLLEAE
ncbi:NAD-dependent protein deacylase [Exaiptasia diaphana]|uniref:NAD-dependent protein deacylase n=1 Tax=Exaiptasia diaphana TaxID=2652724 RepID=A0A913X2A6_EXADI|nr:NAD-dependent protein deacylase [Exaiptasia diaphana]KXJ27367.1 NAD-dependent protein deacylase sirtuin-5, mitochondrial [Exaiptasia diaphana]